MKWSLHDKNGKWLKPFEFSNGKDQEDVVKEVLEAIRDGCKIIFIKAICGSGKCLDKDALVFCKPNNEKYAYYKISKLVGRKGKICCLDKKGNIIESDFKNVRKTGRKEIYHVKTKTGRDVKVSKNHPFLTVTKKGVEWKELSNLRKSDYICLPNLIKSNEKDGLGLNELKILAYLIAEGKLGDKAGSPMFFQSAKYNPEIRSDYIKALKKVFPDGEIVETGKSISLVFRNMDTRFGTTNKLRLFIRKFGLDGKKSKEKFVPSEVFENNNKGISEFLRALYSGDGSIYLKNNKKRKEKQVIIEYCSISHRLIKDISLLLTRFGIQHTITSHKFRGKSDYSRRINISSQSETKKFIEKIGFVGKKQILAQSLLKNLKQHKFTNIDKVPSVIRDYLKNKGYSYAKLDRYLNFEEIKNLRESLSCEKIKKLDSVKTPFVFGQGSMMDFLRCHIKEINKHIRDKTLSFITNENIFWDKIKSIEYVNKNETYDLEVDDYHNFIADGIIVHNSTMALNIAKELGRTSIVVPVKYLQKQYEEDYTNKMHVLKEDGKRLKITNLVGRNNFKCNYNNTRADDKFLPCTIELKAENWGLLKAYIKDNKAVDVEDFNGAEDVRRLSVAAVCPHWSPIIGKGWFKDYGLKDSKILEYKGLKGKKYLYHKRKEGCKYYEQFMSYVDSDVIIFNSKKYEIENLLNRKPETEVEIIDECDEFLDSLGNDKRINLHNMAKRFTEIIGKCKDAELKEVLIEIRDVAEKIIKYKWIDEVIETGEILKINDTNVKNLFNVLVKNDYIKEHEELEYYFTVAKSFEDLMEDTYISFYRNKFGQVMLRVVNTNLEKKLKEILDKNKVFVMMSGTLHSEEVLKNIFGLKDFKIIEAETKHRGKVKKNFTGKEKNYRYKEFKERRVSRKDYLESLNECVLKAKKPFLVHVNSFADLPSDEEKVEHDISVMSREKLEELQERYKKGELLQMFKEGVIDVLYSTRCNRGVDFPGDMCNSIVFTRYPYPGVKDIFWKVLQKKDAKAFKEFYFDKSRREYVQRIYRGLRSAEDVVNLLSPDIVVMRNKLS